MQSQRVTSVIGPVNGDSDYPAVPYYAGEFSAENDGNEIYFIDQSVDDIQALLDTIDDNATVYLLVSSSDGVEMPPGGAK